MRIGFLGPFSASFNSSYGTEEQVGAIEQQFFGIAKQLREKGHEVLITRNWAGRENENVIDGVSLQNVNSFAGSGQGFSDSRFPRRSISYLRYLRAAPKRLAKCNLDVICTTGILQSWFAARTIGKGTTKKIFIAINNDVFIEKGIGHTRTPFITEKMFRSVNREYDALVAATGGLGKYLDGIGINCDFVIPCAVDPTKYFCGNDGEFVLTAARLVPHKRIEQLIQVYHDVSSETTRNLVVIGTGPCESALRQLVESKRISDRVQFLPFLPQSEYKDHLARCSFFVLPSEAEAFGVVVLEAMASGKAVIARNIIGPGDTITDKHDGFLFSNLGDLEKQMRLLLSDEKLRKSVGRKAKETIEKSYSFEHTACKYEKLFESVLQSP